LDEKMILTLHIDEKTQNIEIPQNILKDAEDFFKRMDSDMDRGWQMSREWVANPTVEQRCKIAADRIYTAINVENDNMVMLMAGFILSRAPNVTAVRIATDGDMMENEIISG